MPQTLKILIVEDTPSDIEIYKDIITTINIELAPSIEIQAKYAVSKSEGLEQINALKDDLDGAFIDLKLRGGTTVEVNEGNDLIREIYGKLRFPIIVLTNTPGAFDGDFEKSIFLQLETKTGADYKDIILSLVQIKQTGITTILGRKGLIEKMLDQIFWENISHTLKEWLSIENSEKPLLRYILSHLQERLEISEDGSQFDLFYPIENYFKPSIKSYFFTGDIVRGPGAKKYIILTPACDLAPHGEPKSPKTKDVLLAEIDGLSSGVFSDKVILAKKPPTNSYEEKNIESAKDILRKIIGKNYAQKYYFLSKTSVFDGGLINFQKLTSIKLADLNVNYHKEVSVTAQFIKDIIAKFSFYYSRQGSPDFDVDSILNGYLT